MKQCFHSIPIKIVCLLCLGQVLLLFSCSSASSEAEAEAWAQASKKNSLEALDSFLAAYPNTSHSKEIAKRREGILWQIAERNQTEYHYRYYLDQFPQGKHQDEANANLQAIPNKEIDFGMFSSKTFVGTIRYENEQELEVLALQFKSIDESPSSVRFQASVHLSQDIKKELWGNIELPSLQVVFEEKTEDEFILGLSNGRIYTRDGNIFLESIDPKQYWILR